MSAETAISPANRILPGTRDSAGNDNTSVALFFALNCEFNARMAELLVTITFTEPRSPAAFRARKTNRPSACSPKPAIFFVKMTNAASDTEGTEEHREKPL